MKPKRLITWAFALIVAAALGAWGAKRFGAPGADQRAANQATANQATANQATANQATANQAAAARSQAARPAPAAPMLLAQGDVIALQRVELASGVEVTGTLKAVRSAFVKAKVAGEIRSIAVREGETVRAGQQLAQIDSTELDLRVRQAEDNARAARAQLDIAARASNNSRALVGKGFISPTALENTLATESSARATLDAANAAVEIARKARADATLVAPIPGVVAQRLAQPGERIGVGGGILEIVDLSQLEIEAAVAAELAPRIRVGAKASLSVDGADRPLAATVARINPTMQAGTRALLVYLAVEPHPMLRQGMFATGSITHERREALAVPLTAVHIDRDRPYLLAIASGANGEVVVEKQVTLGMRGMRDGVVLVEITAGAIAGERVLSARAGKLAAGTPVAVGR